MLYRAYKVSNSWNFFDQEKQTIHNLSMKNLYPSYLIDKEIKKFKIANLLQRKTPISFITTKVFLTTNYHTLALIQIVSVLLDVLPSKDCLPVALKYFLCINLLVQDVNPVTLEKPNVIYKQRSGNIYKQVLNLTFFNTGMRILIA